MHTPKTIVDKYLPGRSHTEGGNTVIVPANDKTIGEMVRTLFAAGLPLLSLFATDDRGKEQAFHIHYVFGIPADGAAEKYIAVVPTLEVSGTTFPSFAREFPQTALYEREIMTMFGLKAENHPDPRSLVMHEENWPLEKAPLRKDFAWDTRLPEKNHGTYQFNEIGGEGIYEIPVGPVHAGIIEPGHFRFSVAGEEIVALEARLGWVHKGVEKLFETLPLDKKVVLAERISGDSSFSHSLAFCQALETLTATDVPERAKYLRVIFAELERLTMHVFDIGNIGGNGTGFSFMAAQGFRMVENLRRLSEEVCWSRFLRGINTPGGVARDLSPEQKKRVTAFLEEFKKDFNEVVAVADASASFANRVKATGIIPREVISDFGAVGIAARSCGIAKDARKEFPYAAYGKVAPIVCTTTESDVDARFRLRVAEVHESIRMIEEALKALPQGAISTQLKPLPATGFAVGVVEGWRGEIVYAVFSEDGAISRVKVRDPSFIHWQLFSHLQHGDMVPDFPLINKSFNLSYTGNDL